MNPGSQPLRRLGLFSHLFNMIPLTKNFSLDELCKSDTAIKRNIPNNPSVEQIQCLYDLTVNVLQPLRDKLGKPIRINSGFRSAELNKAVGGSQTSQHSLGQAADLGGDIANMFRIIIDQNLPFDQLIWENTWVHVSYSDRHRRQILHYVNGKYIDISANWREVVK